ncbi:MAG: ATP-binding protein, partial [Syntrophomonadaceae bacterium]
EIDAAQAIARELAFGIQRTRSEERLRASEEHLSREAAALARLTELFAELWRTATLQDGLARILDAAIEILGAERGNVQLWDAASESLHIASEDGLGTEFLEYFREVRAGPESVCGRALRTGQRSIVEDIESDTDLAASTPVLRRAGIRAVQSTPLRRWDGTPVGMVSTHWGTPHRPTDAELRRLDLYLRTATEFIERCGADESLRREIGERQRAEARLRERAEELETILRTVPAPIWIAHDPDCRVVTGNVAAGAILGVPPDVNVSPAPSPRVLPFREYRNGEPIPPSELPLQVAAARGLEVQGAEIEMVLDSGESRHIYGNAAPLRNSDGSIRGSVGAFMDVTELKKATAALEENDRRKNEFLATLGHELRNPLAPMTTGLELLRRLGLSEDAEQVRAMMERQVGAMARLVDDLLDVNRINTGRLKLQTERLPLSAVLQRSIETSRPLIEERGHRLAISIVEDVVLEADPTRLSQVFVALLNNAAQYTETGGTIRLSARTEDGRAVVSVSDTGRGLAATELPRIFEMFSRVGSGASTGHAGLGIGLSLARSLVELHRGSIEARSEGPGKGCEFVVRLPSAPAAATATAAVAPSAATARGGAGLRVLVVDDNRDAAASLAMLLETLGSHVRTAFDGEQAAVVASEFQPHVALLDIGMPTLDGYEAARRIRRESNGRKLKLIALTGYGQESDRRKSEEAGFDRHLVKPLRPQTLIELLADIETGETRSPRAGG